MFYYIYLITQVDYWCYRVREVGFNPVFYDLVKIIRLLWLCSQRVCLQIIDTALLITKVQIQIGTDANMRKFFSSLDEGRWFSLAIPVSPTIPELTTLIEVKESGLKRKHHYSTPLYSSLDYFTPVLDRIL